MPANHRNAVPWIHQAPRSTSVVLGGRALKLSCTQSSIRYVTHQESRTQPQHDLSPVHVSAGILGQHDDDGQGMVPAPRCLARLTLYLQKRFAGHVGGCVACVAQISLLGRLLLAKTLRQSLQSFSLVSVRGAAPRQVLRVEFRAWRRLPSQSLSRLISWRIWFSTMAAGHC
jgi:hypothetical protein